MNEIKAIAFERTNSASGEEFVYRIKSTYEKPHKKSIYVLVIGIQEFANSDFNLKNTRADAKIFTKALKSQEGNGLFDKVNIIELNTTKTTTKEYILRELERLRDIHPEDLFIFYVGSHGVVNDDGKYYLITSNVKDKSSQSIKEGAISEDDIKVAISNIQTSDKFIVFDTCDSGKVVDTITMELLLKKNKGMDDKTALNILSRAVSSMVMSASTSFEDANEDYRGHGRFTYVLVDGINGEADKYSDKNGVVDTSELKKYVSEKLEEINNRKETTRKQTPVINDNGNNFDISRTK